MFAVMAAGACGSVVDDDVGAGGSGTAKTYGGAAKEDDAALKAAFIHTLQQEAGPAYEVQEVEGALVFGNRANDFLAHFAHDGFVLADRHEDEEEWERGVMALAAARITAERARLEQLGRPVPAFSRKARYRRVDATHEL